MLKKLINKYELSSDTRSLKENEIFFDLGSTPNCFGPYFLQALKKKPICVVTKNKEYNNIYSTKIYTVNNLLQFFRLSVIQKYKKNQIIYVQLQELMAKHQLLIIFYN